MWKIISHLVWFALENAFFFPAGYVQYRILLIAGSIVLWHVFFKQSFSQTWTYPLLGTEKQQTELLKAFSLDNVDFFEALQIHLSGNINVQCQECQ